MIRCAMFDFGQVLVRFETQRFYDFLRAHMPNPDILKRRPIFTIEPMVDFDLGRIDTTRMFERIKSELALNVGIAEFLFHFTEVMNPDPKMATLRQILKVNGVKTAVVSNINIYHFQYVQLVYPYVFANFDYPMLSYQHGFEKPDHRMWEIPARHLGVSPEECFFVDDFKSNLVEFMKWSGGLGTGHHYDVVDEKYCPNGRLEEERKKLFLKMFDLNMLTFDQLIKLTFEKNESP